MILCYAQSQQLQTILHMRKSKALKQSRISVWVSTFISAALNYVVILFANSSLSYRIDLQMLAKGLQCKQNSITK